MADNKTQIIITAKDETRSAIASAQAGMQALSGQASMVSASLSSLSGGLVGLSSVLSVSLFAGVVRGAVDAQDKLSDLSKSTSLSIENLSGLSYAAKLSGTDLDGVAAAVNKLSVNIGKDPEKFRAIGISAKEPIEALKQLADVFVGIKDPQQRAALGAEALGKSWASLAPLLADGGQSIGELVEKGTRLSKVTKESAEKAAELNDRMDELKASTAGVSVQLANALVPSMIETLRVMDRMLSSGAPLKTLFSEMSSGIGRQRLSFDPDFASVGTQVSDLEKQLVSLQEKSDFRKKFDSGAINNWLYGDKTDIDKRLETTRTQLETLKKYGDRLSAGKTAVASAPGTSVSEGEINKFLGNTGSKGSASTVSEGDRLIQQLRERLYASQELSEVEKLMAQFADGRYKKMADGERDAALYIASQLDARKAMNSELAEESKRISEIIKLEEIKANRLASMVAGTDSGKAAQRESDEALAWEALGAGSINSKEFDQIINNLNEVKKAGKDTFSELESAINGWGKQSAKAITDFAISGKGSFSDLAKSIISDIGQMAIYAAINPFFENIAGKNSAFGGAISGLFGGGRANGGPVNPGQYYVVGERGPEILVPGTSGTVIPNGAGGGQSNISISIDASGTRSGNDAGSAGELARRLESAVRGVMMVEKRPGGLLA